MPYVQRHPVRALCLVFALLFIAWVTGWLKVEHKPDMSFNTTIGDPTIRDCHVELHNITQSVLDELIEMGIEDWATACAETAQS